jgi:hypothetical protein
MGEIEASPVNYDELLAILCFSRVKLTVDI